MKIISGISMSDLFSDAAASDISKLISPQLREGDISSPETLEAWIEADNKGLIGLFWEALLEAFCTVPLAVDPIFQSDSGVLAAWGKRSITFRDYMDTPTAIYTSPYSGWLRCIGQTRIKCVRYPLSNDPHSLHPSESSEVADNKTAVFVDGKKEAADYIVEVGGLGLRLYDHSTDPTVSMYDRSTLRRIGVTPLVSRDSEIVLALETLAEAGSGHAVTVAFEALKSNTHFVRWAAAKVIARLEPDQAWAVLEGLLSDPHVEVRNAASKSLLRLRGT